ncbi:MAG: hypothetical protein R3Y56_05440 [Akkermansia sp.]
MNQDRKDLAQEIAEKPQQYKICEVCGAIIQRSEDICPECYAYRFNEDEQAIRNRVIDIANKPQQAVGRSDHYRD